MKIFLDSFFHTNFDRFSNLFSACAEALQRENKVFLFPFSENFPEMKNEWNRHNVPYVYIVLYQPCTMSYIS